MAHPGMMQAIITAVDDDAPRLVYADWLDDQGEALRAEFIRLQCRMTQLCVSSDNPRNAHVPAIRDLDLRPELRQPLLAPLLELGLRICENPYHWNADNVGGCNFTFRRGFVEIIDVHGVRHGNEFADRAAAVFQRTPLLHLQFQTSQILGSGRRQQTRLLSIFRSLLAVPALIHLRSLWLTGLQVTGDVARLLLDSPLSDSQTRLSLGINESSKKYTAIMRQRFGDRLVFEEEIPF